MRDRFLANGGGQKQNNSGGCWDPPKLGLLHSHYISPENPYHSPTSATFMGDLPESLVPVSPSRVQRIAEAHRGELRSAQAVKKEAEPGPEIAARLIQAEPFGEYFKLQAGLDMEDIVELGVNVSLLRGDTRLYLTGSGCTHRDAHLCLLIVASRR